MAKTRLDVLLHQRGLVSSREKARAVILAGKVRVNGQRVDKPGSTVEEEARLEVEAPPRYVSRGGFKLEKALAVFDVDFAGKVVLDVGASTGGYTDCALQHGAARVYALDVGYGQLAWSLRNDARVVNIERTNIRYFTREKLGEAVDIITIDVSFISLGKVLPVVKDFIRPQGDIISLVKPQFEAGREKVGKKGVVRDPRVHVQVLWDCLVMAGRQGLYGCNLAYSPLKGPEGNIEFLLHLRQERPDAGYTEKLVEQLVEQAHRDLEG